MFIFFVTHCLSKHTLTHTHAYTHTHTHTHTRTHSGRTGELLSYWQYLRASVTEMATQYREALARSEEGTQLYD